MRAASPHVSLKLSGGFLQLLLAGALQGGEQTALTARPPRLYRSCLEPWVMDGESVDWLGESYSEYPFPPSEERFTLGGATSV